MACLSNAWFGTDLLDCFYAITYPFGGNNFIMIYRGTIPTGRLTGADLAHWTSKELCGGNSSTMRGSTTLSPKSQPT